MKREKSMTPKEHFSEKHPIASLKIFMCAEAKDYPFVRANKFTSSGSVMDKFSKMRCGVLFPVATIKHFLQLR